MRRAVFNASMCLMSSWVAPAPSTRMRNFAWEEPGICASAAVRTARWSATVLLPALPSRSSIASDSCVFAHQAASGWKPKVFLNVAFAPSFLEAARMIVASRSITIHPARRLPATVSQGKPPGRRCSRDHTWRRTRARALAIRTRALSSTAARVRWAVESEAGIPSTAAWWACRASASDRFVAPSTIVLAKATIKCARSRQVALPPAGNSPASAAVSPTGSATWCSSTTPACPTCPLPSAATDSPRLHPVRSLTEKVHLFLQWIRRRNRILAGQRHLLLIHRQINAVG